MPETKAINKVIYGGRVLIDLTGDTITADKLLAGYKAHGADGNIVNAGTLPTFNIKVTGFAVQASTFADYNEAQPELIKLVNSKTSADAQF